MRITNETIVGELTAQDHRTAFVFKKQAIDFCSNTYRVAFVLLKEFEKNLHLHIHPENNIQFSKAIALEKNLAI